ncbi:conjugal transfer protein [Nocardiopsis tropica]|uniref:Conjugal transfer protein n=1 Tax=Nocardiopsis tropica TaxID=109330 RepID=A0ABU7KMV1_9ACTN|nr:conjugal transfer protein [Nocardiopsis umidischolae]MEE2050625.1 conjugal transfer protein [Nocardiopsis umidischolae]
MSQALPTEPTRSTREPWFAPYLPRSARTILVQLLVWLAVLSGPAALFAQFTQSGPAVPETGPERSTRESDPSVIAVAGWAERVITAYVEGDIDTVRANFPTISDRQLEALPTPTTEATRISTVAVDQIADEEWAVTVAVYPRREDPTSPAVRHLQLAVHGTNASWAALTLPTEVGAWGPTDVPELAYASRRLADSRLTDAVQGWAAAYLIGDGELDRYMAPEATYPPITMAHTAVEIDGVYPAQAQEETATAPPGDGDTVPVLVDLTVTTTDGQTWPMSYVLELTSRSQRWEISAVATPPLI